MYIKYRIEKETVLKGDLLIGKIAYLLARQDYIVTARTRERLLFKDDNWQIRAKNALLSLVDKGEFEVTALVDGSSLVRYTCYISVLPLLVITFILAVTIIWLDYYYILIIALPFFIQFVVRMNRLKEVSNEMLEGITSVSP